MSISKSTSVVCSYNEWDLLEEVIVGSVIGAAQMGFEPAISAYYPLRSKKRSFKGARYSEIEIEKASDRQKEFLLSLIESNISNPIEQKQWKSEINTLSKEDASAKIQFFMQK